MEQLQIRQETSLETTKKRSQWKDGELSMLKVLGQQLPKTDRELVENSCSRLMLSEMTEQEAEGDLLKTLPAIGLLVGVDNPPLPEELLILKKSVLRNYGNLTTAEIYQAFELNVIGVYPEKIKHFQSLNFDYVSSVLNQFKSYKAGVWISWNKIKASKTLELNPVPKSSPEQSYTFIKNHFLESGEFPLAANYWSAFDWMIEVELTEDNATLKEYFARESQALIASINERIKNCSNMFEKQKIEYELAEQNIRAICRKRYIQKRIPQLCPASQPTNSSDL